MKLGTSRHYVLALLLAVYVTNYLDRTILVTVLEPIKREWSLSDGALGFLSGLTFAVFYATLGMPIAMAADRWPRRNIITIAAAIWSGMTIACGLAASYWQLLFARIGVGIGEAGGTPPAHSIISDLYPLNQRATAMAIYSLGVPIGILLGFLIGGAVASEYGWRAAFFVVGAPGLVLAATVRLTLREPVRGASDFDATALAGISAAPSFPAAIRMYFRRPAMVHLTIASTINAFAGYGSLHWLSSFLARTHHMGLAERSTFLALAIGLGGLIGNFATGYLSDRLALRDLRWKIWVVSIGAAIAAPFSAAALLADDRVTAMALLIIPTFAGSLYLGPVWALMPGLVSVRMRALASAIGLFILNMIGLGAGPWTVGQISDLLVPTFGDDSLRYALLSGPVLSLWSALHFYRVGRTLADDLAATKAADSAMT